MITDEKLESYAQTGLDAISETFTEDGETANLVLLINAEGRKAFTPYDGGDRGRFTVGMAALYHKAVAAVMIGEAWFRDMKPDEPREYVRLVDDPEAHEELFAIAVRAGSANCYRASRLITRGDRGETTLVDRAAGWDGQVDSWLLDVLNKIGELMGDGS